MRVKKKLPDWEGTSGNCVKHPLLFCNERTVWVNVNLNICMAFSLVLSKYIQQRAGEKLSIMPWIKDPLISSSVLLKEYFLHLYLDVLSSIIVSFKNWSFFYLLEANASDYSDFDWAYISFSYFDERELEDIFNFFRGSVIANLIVLLPFSVDSWLFHLFSSF